MNKIVIFLIIEFFSFFISFQVFAQANDVQFEEGMIYQGVGGKYININGNTYGPYDKISHVQIRELNWGFKGYQNWLSPNEKYFYILNGKEYGPYTNSNKSISDDIMVSNIGYWFNYKENEKSYIQINGIIYGPYLTISQAKIYSNLITYIYQLNENEYYVKINNIDYGPFDDVSWVRSDEKYYGFYGTKNNEANVVVNGKTYFYGKNDEILNNIIESFEINENYWAGLIKRESKEGKHSYTFLVNGDEFGPFAENEFIDFRVSKKTWVFFYTRDNKFYVLSNDKPLYQLPITEEQIQKTKEFMESEGYRIPFQDPFCFDNKALPDSPLYQGYFGLIRFEEDYENLGMWALMHPEKDWKTGKDWEIGYLIDGECVSFQDESVENKFSILNSKLSNRLKGKIILKVEDKGMAYYLNPRTNEAYYLGRPIDAFSVMREQGLGISENNFNSYQGYAPRNLAGLILLRVEAKGEAYYVNPSDLKMYYLGRPADAFNVMRNLGLGISNNDFNNLSN